MNKVYSRIQWENEPSHRTALNEDNLNKMDNALDMIDNRVISMDTNKANQATVLGMIKDASWDPKTGIITLTKLNGEKIIFDINVEKIPVSFSMDKNGVITMVTSDGTRFTADISQMIPVLQFENSNEIIVYSSGSGIDKTYSFTVKSGAIKEKHLDPNYLSQIKTEVSKASSSASAAAASASLSKSYAVGGTGTREGEDEDNAKYYYEQAKNQANVPENISAFNNDVGYITNSALEPYLKKKGDGSNITVTTQQSGTRENIASGESIKVSFGKIMKWFSDLASGAASTLLGSNLTTNRALASDANGKVTVSPVTATELGYLDGVKSNVQEQINEVNNNLKKTVTHIEGYIYEADAPPKQWCRISPKVTLAPNKTYEIFCWVRNQGGGQVEVDKLNFYIELGISPNDSFTGDSLAASKSGDWLATSMSFVYTTGSSTEYNLFVRHDGAAHFIDCRADFVTV